MTRTTLRVWLVVAASGLAFTVSATGARKDQASGANPAAPAPQVDATADSTTLNEEELARVGEELVYRACDTSCHGPEKLDEMRRTGREWDSLIIEMAGRGAMATEAQFRIIKRYLTRYYGFVAINTAPAEELSAVMGFSATDAQAIVEYRAAHGRFADVDAVLKVPGIDRTKIEEQPDALRFN